MRYFIDTTFSSNSLFYSDAKKIHHTIGELSFSSYVDFSNSKQTINYSSIQRRTINVVYSPVYSYNSNANAILSKPTLSYSSGTVPYEEVVIELNREDSTYEDIVNMLSNIDTIGYYWFDSSIPSYKQKLQAFVVPTDTINDNWQFSIQFPYIDTNIEFEVVEVSKQYDVSLELDFYPPVIDTYINNIEFTTSFYDYIITLEWGTGVPTTYGISVETEVLPDWLNITSTEFVVGLDTDIDINFESSLKPSLHAMCDIEYDMLYTTLYSKLNIEFMHVYIDDYTVNFEHNMPLESNNLLTLEYVGRVSNNVNINLEYIFSYEAMYNTNIEFTNIVIDNYTIDIEADIRTAVSRYIDTEFFVSTADKRVNIEWARVYHEVYTTDIEYDTEINKAIVLDITSAISINELLVQNIEWKRVYTALEYPNMEYDVYEVNKENELSLEWLGFTDIMFSLDIEFLKMYDTKVYYQTYVIPLDYHGDNLQVKILATYEAILGFEVDIPFISKTDIISSEFTVEINDLRIVDIEVYIPNISIVKTLDIEYDSSIEKVNVTNIETIVVYEDIADPLNFEVFTDIDIDNIVNIEMVVTSINKIEELTIEVVTSQDDDYVINTEFAIYINAIETIDAEFTIDSFILDADIGIEIDTAINLDYELSLEAYIHTVSKRIDFEFDVLDLVYYVITAGRNIVPWLYSDGLGYWDTTVDNNWNKQSTDMTTIQTGIYEQLSDRDLSLPEVLTVSEDLQVLNTVVGEYNATSVIRNSYITYDSTDDTYVLLLGKKKKDVERDIQLYRGENIVIYDCEYNKQTPPTVNSKIRNKIVDYEESIVVWDQVQRIWIPVIDDHDLYFIYEYEGKELVMPYILNIVVNDDCTLHIDA